MRRIISIFMLSLFMTTLTKAEEVILEDGDFIEVKEGEQAPFDGYLFDHGGVAALIARHEKEKSNFFIEKDAEIKTLKVNLETQIKQKDIEIDINKKLSDDIIKLNKQELKLAQDKLGRLNWLTPASFVAGVIAGTFLTVSILKIAIGVTQ
jgi:uncharacterized protein YwgA